MIASRADFFYDTSNFPFTIAHPSSLKVSQVACIVEALMEANASIPFRFHSTFAKDSPSRSRSPSGHLPRLQGNLDDFISRGHSSKLLSTTISLRHENDHDEVQVVDDDEVQISESPQVPISIDDFHPNSRPELKKSSAIVPTDHTSSSTSPTPFTNTPLTNSQSLPSSPSITSQSRPSSPSITSHPPPSITIPSISDTLPARPITSAPNTMTANSHHTMPSTPTPLQVSSSITPTTSSYTSIFWVEVSASIASNRCDQMKQ